MAYEFNSTWIAQSQVCSNHEFSALSISLTYTYTHTHTQNKKYSSRARTHAHTHTHPGSASAACQQSCGICWALKTNSVEKGMHEKTAAATLACFLLLRCLCFFLFCFRGQLMTSFSFLTATQQQGGWEKLKRTFPKRKPYETDDPKPLKHWNNPGKANHNKTYRAEEQFFTLWLDFIPLTEWFIHAVINNLCFLYYLL